MPRFVRGLALAGALVLAGCGVGGNEAPQTAEQPEITKAQLAAMVLPRAELGSASKGLEVDDDAGPVDNAEAADDSFDPDDTGKSLAEDGRVLGYELDYSHPKLLSAKKGVLSVGSSVELFQDPVYAAQFLHERFGDFERFRGAVPGFQLSAHARFDAIGVGDEAAGERLKVKVSGVVTGYVTDVWFRRGRIVGYVEVVRADKQAAHDVALELATALDHRIQAVLAGEIEVEKAKPPKSKEATAAELRKLPSQTLAPADVGPNAVVLEEGPTEDEDYAGYRRSFRDLKVGGSRVLWLNGETQLYETGKHAELAHKVRTEKAGRLIFAQAVIDGFAGGAGLTPTDVRARALAIPAGGLKGLVVTFELQEAKFAMVGVFTRSGRLVQSLLAIGRTATFEADDLEAVARRAKKRLAS